MTLNLVAHEDDDLLFMSPDVLHDVQSSRCVTTVYLTAGDAGDSADYWQGREAGVEAAYASMAGVSDSWSPSTLTVSSSDGNHSIAERTLIADPSISLVFLRLPDGGDTGSGFQSTGYESLKKLWSQNYPTPRVHPVDGSSTSGYTKSGLTSTLTSLMNQFQPDTIRTQDYVNTGALGSNDDHSDHQATGLFTYTAQQTYAPAHTITAYFDYDTTRYPQNVIGTDLTAKQNAFYQYGANDSHVDCDSGASCDATYAAWIKRQYTVPYANAGPDRTVTTGAAVQLQGATSFDPYNKTLTYQWTQTSGTTVSLSSHTVANPDFTAPASADALTFKLTVNDGTASSTDSVTVAVVANTANIAGLATPTASSGYDANGQGADKAIDGYTDGEPNGDPEHEWATIGGKAGSWLQLNWSSPQAIDHIVLFDRPNPDDQITGATLTFSSGGSVTVPSLANDGSPVTIDFPARTTTSVRLTINSVSSTTLNIGLAEIEVWTDRHPIAQAGPDQSVNTGDLVTLDGSASSDASVSDTLSYQWTQTGGAPVTLSSSTAQKPTFTAPASAGAVTFDLTVSDGALSDSDSVTIDVPDRAPVASAGPDQTVNTSDLVTLDGTASTDPDSGDVLVYTWEQTDGALVTLSNPNAPQPSFIAPASASTLTFKLTVSDGTLESNDTVVITVPDRAPTANAGPDQNVNTSTSVTLDGSLSTDPDSGDVLTYAWEQTGGTAVTLSSTSAQKPTFTTPASASTLTF
ncbi:MAG: PKD domain-containing protein, partial [Gaiellaceae bacterium]